MVNLVQLDLSRNGLSSLPAPLATSLRALARLDLSYNAFTRLPQARPASPCCAGTCLRVAAVCAWATP